jgi:hypothetical protein
MHIITKDFVHRIDDKLISADVALHARPFCVVIEWMKEKISLAISWIRRYGNQ